MHKLINRSVLAVSGYFSLLAMLIVMSTPAQAESYLYDAAGRLTRVSYTDGNLAFAYDNNGNILRRYTFLTPPDDASCSGLQVTIIGRVFTDNVTCTAVNSFVADAVQISTGVEVIFVSPQHQLTNGFSVQQGSIFRALAP